MSHTHLMLLAASVMRDALVGLKAFTRTSRISCSLTILLTESMLLMSSTTHVRYVVFLECYHVQQQGDDYLICVYVRIYMYVCIYI